MGRGSACEKSSGEVSHENLRGPDRDVLLVAGYFLFVFNWSYSEGERAGWIQKFSAKDGCARPGGELAMVSMPGSMSEKFFFTVWTMQPRTDHKMMGKRVSLHYEEKVGIPTSCFGEPVLRDQSRSGRGDPARARVVVPTQPAPAAPSAPIKP